MQIARIAQSNDQTTRKSPMARRKLQFAFFFALCIFFAAGPQPLFAQAIYHIGSGQAGENRYDTLKDFAEAFASVPSGRILLYADDASLGLDNRFYVGGGQVVQLESDEIGEKRTISTDGSEYLYVVDSFAHASLYISGDIVFDGAMASRSVIHWFSGLMNMDGVTIRNNSEGGAISNFVGTTISARGVTIENNGTSNTFSMGGADLSRDTITDFTDAVFRNNSGGTFASGGAVRLQPMLPSTVARLTLGATEGETSVFEGNMGRLSLLSEQISNSILFDGGGQFYVSVHTEKDGTLEMHDPMHAIREGIFEQILEITKTGDGTWILGGENMLTNTNGHAYVNIQQGRLGFYEGASLNLLGENDQLTVAQQGELYLDKKALIQATTVNLNTNSTVTVDMGYYAGKTEDERARDEILTLNAGTKNYHGTRLRVTNLVSGEYGKYLLFKSDTAWNADNFNLSVNGWSVQGSKRWGYDLNTTDNPTELALNYSAQDNAIVQWDPTVSGAPGNNIWSSADRNWTFPYRTDPPVSPDSFIDGDTAVFRASGYQAVTISSFDGAGVRIGSVTTESETGIYTFYRDNALGMDVGGNAHWEFNGESINDLYDPDLAGDPVNDAKKAGLYYSGNGSLRMRNAANTYHGDTVHGGTGTIYVSNVAHFGSGDFVFRDNGATDNVSKIVFEESMTVSDRKFRAIEDGNGHVTAATGKTLRITNANGTAAVEIDGGTLTLEGESREALLLQGGRAPNGGAVSVRNGGEFIAKSITIRDNRTADMPGGDTAAMGGAVYATDSTVRIENSSVTENQALFGGGVVYATGSNVIVDSSDFVGNRADFYGGGIYTVDSDVTLRNSEFRNNTAGRDGGSGMTGGGAIAFYDYQGGKTLTLESTDGKTTLFSGNTSGHGSNRKSDSILVYAAGNTPTTIDVITHEAGIVDMRDAMSGSAAANARLDISKTGAGTWKLGGTHTFSAAANGEVHFDLAEGTLSLYKADTENGIGAGRIEMTGAGTEFAIRPGATLLANGGNEISTETIVFGNDAGQNAFLAFEMNDVSPDNEKLLTLSANRWDTNNWTVNVSLVNPDLSVLDRDQTRTYALFSTNDSKMTQANIDENTVLYYGRDKMEDLRENFGTLIVDGNTVYVEMSAPLLGVTDWKPRPGNERVWDRVTENWEGTSLGETDLTDKRKFLDNDSVRFFDEGAGLVTVDSQGVKISAYDDGVHFFAGMTFNNSAGNDYTFQGGSIGGTGGLEKFGTGSVLFDNENTFEGGSVIHEGTVVARRGASLGTGPVQVDSGAMLQFDFPTGTDEILGQELTGGGTLRKTGYGSLIIDRENTSFTGATEIRAGALVFRVADAVGTGVIDTGFGSESGRLVLDGLTGDFGKQVVGTGAVHITGENSDVRLTNIENGYSGGTVVEKDSKLTIGNFDVAGTGNLRSDGLLVLDFAGEQTLDGRSLLGEGVIRKTGVGELKLGTDNEFSGHFEMTEGELRFDNPLALQNATLVYTGGELDFASSNTVTIAGLAGDKDIALENEFVRKVDLVINTKESARNEYSGILSGEGDLIVSGNGTQVFSGANEYTGRTFIRNARLVAVGSAALGTGKLTNDGVLEFEIDDEDRFDRIISGTGSVEKSGTGTLELLAENTYTGGTKVAAGTLRVQSLKALGMHVQPETGTSPGVEIQSGAVLDLNLDHGFERSAHNTITQTITGSGTLSKTGAGALYLDGNLNLAGKVDIKAGLFQMSGNTSSALTVYDKATFSGTGTVDNTILFKRGSTHRIDSQRESQLSTFTAKNVEYEGGTTVYIKVGQAGADRVVAKDGIDFAKGGGTVNVVLVNLGMYDPEEDQVTRTVEVFSSEEGKLTLNGRKIFNVENASGALTVAETDGEIRFTGDPDGGLNVIGYSVRNIDEYARGIFLNVSQISSADPYLNWNQLQTLAGVGDAGTFDTIYGFGHRDRGDVIDQLMPMVQTVVPYLNQRSITQFNTGTFERLRYRRMPVTPVAMTEDGSELRGQSSRWAWLRDRLRGENQLWFQNYGDFITMQAHGSKPEFNVDSYGFSLGLDRALNHQATFGIGMGGYFGNVRTMRGLQKGDVDSFVLAAYGDWVADEDWSIAASTGFTFSENTFERRAPAFGTTLTSKHDGTAYFISVEAAKKFLIGRTELTPYIGVDGIWLHEKRYGENAEGNSALALSMPKNNTSSILSTMGLRVGRTFRTLGGNDITPTVYAAWVHDYNSGEVVLSSAFDGQTNFFRIRGASMYRDRAQVGTTVNVTLNNRMDMFGRFNAELGRSMSNLAVHWGFRLGF